MATPEPIDSGDWRVRLRDYALLVRLDRPIGILLLLWPTLWALWIAAGGVPDLKLLAIFTAGTVLMRSAGCIINDLADRNLDGGVTRTSGRPLVTGAVSVKEATTFFLLLAVERWLARGRSNIAWAIVCAGLSMLAKESGFGLPLQFLI